MGAIRYAPLLVFVPLALCAAPSPFPTIPASTRNTIDRSALANSPISDATLASVGALDAFGDGLGSLVTTAVLVGMPLNPVGSNSTFRYQITRIDILLYVVSQASNRLNPSDLAVSLYADDASATHNPGVKVRLFRLL
jgi:hypothetical protein